MRSSPFAPAVAVLLLAGACSHQDGNVTVTATSTTSGHQGQGGGTSTAGPRGLRGLRMPRQYAPTPRSAGGQPAGGQPQGAQPAGGSGGQGSPLPAGPAAAGGQSSGASGGQSPNASLTTGGVNLQFQSGSRTLLLRPAAGALPSGAPPSASQPVQYDPITDTWIFQ